MITRNIYIVGLLDIHVTHHLITRDSESGWTALVVTQPSLVQISIISLSFLNNTVCKKTGTMHIPGIRMLLFQFYLNLDCLRV